MIRLYLIRCSTKVYFVICIIAIFWNLVEYPYTLTCIITPSIISFPIFKGSTRARYVRFAFWENSISWLHTPQI